MESALPELCRRIGEALRLRRGRYETKLRMLRAAGARIGRTCGQTMGRHLRAGGEFAMTAAFAHEALGGHMQTGNRR